MPQPRHSLASLVLVPVLGLPACNRPWDTGFDLLGACRAVQGIGDDSDHYVITRVASEEYPDGVTVEAIVPRDRGLLPDGAPAVLVLPGGFDLDSVPVEGSTRVIDTGQGLIQVYLNLPGGSGAWSTPGDADWRGASTRRAVATALRWTAGEIPDEDGCTLADRSPVPLSAVGPFLHGHSNGGNLAVATLADEALDLPVVTGITTFETPAAPQFVTVEIGSRTFPNPYYTDGTCSLDDQGAILCPISYAWADWLPEASGDGGVSGAVYFDADQDGAFNPLLDPLVWGNRPLLQGTSWTIYSPTLTSHAEMAAWDIPGLMPADESDAFWSIRDAARGARAALDRQPGLAAIVIGTARDHMLGAPDHPHVTGLAAALEQAGSPWVRVNPDSAWVRTLTDDDAAFSDNPANPDTRPGDPTQQLEPDEEETGLTHRAFITAALLELAERAWLQQWSVDEDARPTVQ